MTKAEFEKTFGYTPTAEQLKTASDNKVSQTHELKIKYLKSDEEAFNLNIPDYKTGITDEEISDNAKSIMQQNVFAPNGLSLIKVASAKRVDTVTTDVTIEQ